MDGDAGVGHRLVRERVDLGDAAQVDDGAHTAFLDQVHDVVGRGVGEGVAAEHAVVAGHAVARRVPAQVPEIHQARDRRNAGSRPSSGDYSHAISEVREK